MDIVLNDAEQKLAVHLAKSRYQNARDKGKVDLKKGDQSNWETDLEGIGGELAACKAFNAYPDTEIDLIDLPNFDLTTRNGRTVDAKTTKYSDGRLIAALWKINKKCDLYVLVVGEFPTYRIAGAMTGSELMVDERITDLGKGDLYAADQCDLEKVTPCT